MAVYSDAMQKKPATNLGKLLATSVSEGTWALRRRLANLKDATVSEIVEARMADGVAPSTVAKELGQIAWLADRQLHKMDQLDRRMLDDVKTAIRKRPHSVTKALPMTHAWVTELTGPKSTLSSSSKALVQMAFLSASRVEDCVGLTAEALREMLRSTAVVFKTSKTNQAGDARPDHHTRVTVTRGSALHRHILQNKAFTAKEARTLEEELPKARVDKEYVAFWRQKARVSGDLVRDHFTLHSMKRGAAYHLWRAAAAKEITLDQLKAQLKHQDLKSSLEYAPDRALVATAMSGHTTLRLVMPTL